MCLILVEFLIFKQWRRRHGSLNVHTFFTHPLDTTECCCWQNQNVIRTCNVLVHTKECKWIQRNVVVGKIGMLLGQGNVAVNQSR